MLSLTRCAFTTSCGWPNLGLKVFYASLYIKPLYGNSAIAIFALAVKSGLR